MFGVEIKSIKEGNKLIRLDIEVCTTGDKLVARATAVLDLVSEDVVLKCDGLLSWAEDAASAVTEWLQDNLEGVDLPDWF
jgi:hypothetical protein